MKILIFMFSIFLYCTSVYAEHTEISVEAGNLHAIPVNVQTAIDANASYKDFIKLGCVVKGISIGLSKNRMIKSWFTTTSGACGWGAALAPIWIVSGNTASLSVVLATNGFALRVLSPTHHGMADILILGGTAGNEQLRKYRYDGVLYTPSHERPRTKNERLVGGN